MDPFNPNALDFGAVGPDGLPLNDPNRQQLPQIPPAGDPGGNGAGGIVDATVQGAGFLGDIASSAADVVSGAAEIVGSVATGAAEAVGGAAEGIGGLVDGVGSAADGCGSCSLALLIALCASAGTAVAALMR